MTRFTKACGLFAALAALATFGGCASDDAQPVPVSANACPAWVEYPAGSGSNAGSAYLGCVNALNLRHMVEDPNDLRHGRALGPADGERQALAVKNYEEDKVKQSGDLETSHTIFMPVTTGGTSGG